MILQIRTRKRPNFWNHKAVRIIKYGLNSSLVLQLLMRIKICASVMYTGQLYITSIKWIKHGK